MTRERLGSLPLAELVAKQRERLSLSLEETAQRVQSAASSEDTYCAFTRQTMYEIERGRIPHPRNLRWLAAGLDVTVQVSAGVGSQGWPWYRPRRTASGFRPCLRVVDR